MAENKSNDLHLGGFSSEDNNLFEDQGKPVEVPFGMLGSSTDEDYSLLTPEQKLDSQKQDTPLYTTKLYLSSISGSSDVSAKEGYEAVSSSSSSSSSSDTESGTYDLRMKNYLLGNDVLQPKVIDSEFDDNANIENLHIVNEEQEKAKDALYKELLEKVANYEDELNMTKNKLHFSEEEIANLKHENLTLVEELTNAAEKLLLSEDSLEKMEKKLKDEFNEQQNQLQAKLDLANQSIDHLQSELGSESRWNSELRDTISKQTNELNNYSFEIEQLKSALHDAQKSFSRDISSLNKQKDELQLRNKMFEQQINQYEAEKTEAGNREKGLLDEIEQLNKSFDAHKLMYNTLMVERDEGLAKVQTLAAELNNKDNYILQMMESCSKLTAERKELIDESEKKQKTVEELRLKVKDHEQEMLKQRDDVYEREEEKREAIRQLCFSLEYYRTGYHELRQAFTKHKRPAVFAA